jgi:tetratricopeptide (TPR) repeat protein
VLSIASVVGREFRLDVLHQVAALPVETIEGALEEAAAVAVVEQRTGVGGQLSFRFTHAFFRQTLYEELFAARRIRLHQQVARALEAVYGRRVEEHAAELAEHYANSSDPADLRKAVAYGEMAARRSMSVFAYGEAVRQYENAFKAQEVLDPDDAARRCDLLLAQCEAMLPAEEPARVARGPAEQAFELAEALGDNTRAAKAAVLALESIDRSAQLASARGGPAGQTWAERADEYAADGTRERILADAYIGVSRLQVTGPVSAHPHLRRAAEAALTTSDQGAFYKAAGLTLRQLLSVRDRDFVQTVADAVMSRPRQGAPSGDLGICLTYLGAALLERGDRSAAERAWAEMNELAERTRDAGQQVNAQSAGTLLARLDGRLEEAVSIADSHSARAEELGVIPFTGLTGTHALVFLGREQEVLASKRVMDPRGRPNWATAAWCLAQFNHHDEARQLRERFGDLSAESDETASTLLALLMESAVQDGDVEFVQAVSPRVAGMTRFACAGTTLISWPRILGAGAALLGEPERARALYEQAFESSGRLRNRPELALTHLQLAELLLENGDGTDREEALHHLDFAIAEFREMKMQPSLERALRHKDVLKA